MSATNQDLGAENALRSASKKAPLGADQDFAGLHNVYKQIIFLQESVNAALQTVKHLSNYHQSPGAPGYRPMASTTFRMLALVQTKFESTQLRLSSLEKRMQNVISLVGSRRDKDWAIGD
jgi:hypothetical protein